MTRRGLLFMLLGSGVVQPTHAADHFPFGPLSAPRTIPGWAMTTDAGVATHLTTLLQGHVTALHLMFTTCTATCPIQGATLAKAQRVLAGRVAGARFLSVSVDPEQDRPARLAAWLKTFDARPGWMALCPREADLDDITKILGEGGVSPPQGADPHSGQVYLIDRAGRLVYRTAAMPSAQHVVDAMIAVAGGTLVSPPSR
jgi:protein SCO1